VPGDLPLDQCPERRVGLALPAVLSERLDELVMIIEAAGERTSRKELLGSLLLAAPSDGAALARAVKQYRRATVRSAMVREADSFSPQRHGPGPRPRHLA
jgi:hypothetical protein